MFNPWPLLAALVAALALFGAGYGVGWRHGGNACDAIQMAEDRRQRTATAREEVRREAVGAAREVSREKIRIVYRTIKEAANAYAEDGGQKTEDSSHRSHAPRGNDKGAAQPHNDLSSDFCPLSSGCGLDADGLRLWNAANSGGAAPVSGEPDYTLPAAAAGQIGKVAGLAAKPYRGDGAGGAVPGPAGEAGGVR